MKSRRPGSQIARVGAGRASQGAGAARCRWCGRSLPAAVPGPGVRSPTKSTPENVRRVRAIARALVRLGDELHAEAEGEAAVYYARLGAPGRGGGAVRGGRWGLPPAGAGGGRAVGGLGAPRAAARAKLAQERRSPTLEARSLPQVGSIGARRTVFWTEMMHATATSVPTRANEGPTRQQEKYHASFGPSGATRLCLLQPPELPCHLTMLYWTDTTRLLKGQPTRVR